MGARAARAAARRGAEERDALAGDRLERPGRSTARRTGIPGRTWARSALASVLVRRVVLGHRDDDEIGDAARGTRSGSPRRRPSAERRDDDEQPRGLRRPAASPRRSRRARRARGRATRDADAPRARSRPRRRRRARRRSAGSPTVVTPATTAVSRWSDAACRPRRESSSSVSTVGLTRRSRARAGRPGPSRRRRSRRVARESAARRGPLPPSCRRACRCRSPRASGTSTGSQRRRVEAEVGPFVRDAECERAAREREPLGGPSTGSSERSRTTSGR